jgi:general secretion pathway protein D
MKRVNQTFLITTTLVCGLFFLLSGTPVLAQNPPAANAATTEAAKIPIRKDQLVSIDFNNVDIGIFIKFISDLTQKNFVIDDRVKGKVTIISPGKITVAEAYQVFESVLEVNGYAAVPSGQITKIVSAPDARSKNIKTRLKEESGTPGDSVVTQIIPLRYADPNEIKTLFTPLVSKNSVIQAYPPTNTLIITDVYSNIKRLVRILKAIDITGVGQQIAIIPVQNADAGKMVTLLQSVFATQKKGRGAITKDLVFVADERTNVIVVQASEGDTERIRQLVKILDQETPKGQAKIRVYYLEHAAAEDLAAVLKDIPQKESGQPKEGKKTAPVISDKVRIAPDKATNSLIIMADADDYAAIEQIIRKIDIPRTMVYIEALIMEVNVNKDFRLGAEWMAGGESSYNGIDGFYAGGFGGGAAGGDNTAYTTLGPINAAIGNTIPALAPGFSLGAFGESIEINGIKFPSIGAIFQAYKKDGDVSILSTPQILTTDNQEAKIYVGKNVPFQTQSTTTNNDTFNSFEYRDVGRTLKITPHINIDRMVRLEISLESTELESTADNRPTTLKRTVDTTAIVKDQNTVVLGGLIDSTSSNTVYKVPCLGDIPGLGILFSSRASAKQKTNLYVFLTPRVIQNSGEARDIYNKKRNEINGLRNENIKLYNHSAPDIPDGQEPWVEGSNSSPQSQAETFTQPANTPLEPDTEAAPAADIAIDHAAPAAINASPSPWTPLTEDSPPPSAPGQVPGQEQAAPAPPDPVATPTTPTDNASAATQAPATSSQPADASDATEGYTVQVASVQTPQQADQILKQLTEKGYAAYTVQTEVDDKTWYRLRIGYFATAEKADPLLLKLRSDNYNPLLIKF